MKREHLRVVVWPRGEKTPGAWAYTIVGVLVTDKPIPELTGNEFLLDGATFGAIGDILAVLPQEEPNWIIGDASDALVGLNDLAGPESIGDVVDVLLYPAPEDEVVTEG